MPSAQQLFTAYDCLRVEQERIAGLGASLNRLTRAEAANRAERAREALRALEPLLAEEGARLAEEAQVYVDRGVARD